MVFFCVCVALIALPLPTSAQCGPGGEKPYPPGSSACPTRGGASPAPGGGYFGAGAPASSSSHAAPMLGDVAKTAATGTDARTGKFFSSGENIYGPFEAGFGSAQDNILQSLGCSQGSLGHVDGGIDTYTAEQMVAQQCSITLPRVVGNSYISLLDECGGHTNEYHFHERMSCLYDGTLGVHSAKVGQVLDGKFLYGKWEHTTQQQLPLLDACGGHYGTTPESPSQAVYHYHVQDKAPFTVGCFGPNDDNSLVTVRQCRSFYAGCDGDLATVTTPMGAKSYDKWCPCFDANGMNTGVNIAELAVFTPAPTPVPASGAPTPAPTPELSTQAPTPALTTKAPSVFRPAVGIPSRVAHPSSAQSSSARLVALVAVTFGILLL